MCRECFDAIYGSSAGAINATYFLSGQREGVRIYYEDIANKKFVDLGRLLDRKKEQGLSGLASFVSFDWHYAFQYTALYCYVCSFGALCSTPFLTMEFDQASC